MKELLHFTADWCQPCKKMAPMIDEFVSNNPEIIYTKINVDTDSAFVEEYEIRGVPTFIVRNDGEVTNRHTGVATADKFAALFN